MSPRNRMARILLLYFICGLLPEHGLYCGVNSGTGWTIGKGEPRFHGNIPIILKKAKKKHGLQLLPTNITTESRQQTICPTSVFLPQHTAESVLKRHRRYNAGGLEEVMKDNLERECIEERCSWEEAREVFENREKTMQFWVSYMDGDQCESLPCQNEGKCEDGMSSYMCWCPVGYTGKNCEIETLRQCDVRNGGCMHFCHSDKVRGVTCDCAAGYSLNQDGRTCKPEGDFPCGRRGKSIVLGRSKTRTFHAQPPEMGSNDTIHSPPLLNATAVPSEPTANSTTPSPTTPSPTSATTTRPPLIDVPIAAFLPTLPTIVTKEPQDNRIVGGNEVTPGEIPWQVALIDKRTLVGFCGGSILSEHWIITAAHCLLEAEIDSIFIRVGEHNVHKKEGTERDHEIAEKHVHPRYNNVQSQYNHDVALLRLEKPIVFTDFALPICLGPKEFTEILLRTGSMSVVSGWGKVRFEGAESPVLQKVEVPYVDRLQCKGSSNDRITRFMFCAGYTTEKRDSCQGDSGGPHTTKQGDTWFLTGIVSWGEECAKEGKFGIYTRVSRYYAWISYVTGIRKVASYEDHEH